LGEQRRHIPGGAEIQRICTQRLQQRRAGGELGPADADAQWGQPPLDGTAGLGQRESAAFLPADAEFLSGALRAACGWQRQNGGGTSEERKSLSAGKHEKYL